jgi:mannitol-1-phosphate/altronate dehydrogenase
MSCDNIQGNGHMSQGTFSAFASLKDPELGEWVRATVAFPNSMVDRITPVTTDADRAEVAERFGITDQWPVVCEPFFQWVLEENFPLGRPPYEDAAVQIVEDVEPYELMKLRLLNASHQAMASASPTPKYATPSRGCAPNHPTASPSGCCLLCARTSRAEVRSRFPPVSSRVGRATTKR